MKEHFFYYFLDDAIKKYNLVVGKVGIVLVLHMASILNYIKQLLKQYFVTLVLLSFFVFYIKPF